MYIVTIVYSFELANDDAYRVHVVCACGRVF